MLNPLYKSSVSLADCSVHEGEVSERKKEAEFSAAKVAYLYVQKGIKLPKSRDSFRIDLKGKKIGVLVDSENVPKVFLDVLNKSKVDGIHYYDVFGVGHHRYANQDMEIAPRRYISTVISPSTRPDGSDTCIIMLTAVLLFEKKFDAYLIMTADHFGESLADMVRTPGLGWEPRPCYVVRCMADFRRAIETLVRLEFKLQP